MERLTEYDEHGNAHVKDFDGTFCAAIDRLAAYEDTGRTPEEIKEMLDWSFGLFSEKIGDFLQAKSEGRLIVLPCKVGDTVYVVDRGKIFEEEVRAFSTFKTNKGETTTAMAASHGYCLTKPNISDPGVLRHDNRLSFFFSREEAERALEVSG